MLDTAAINTISAEARRRAGIAIPQAQTYLVEARLAPVARSEGYDSQADLVRALETDGEESAAILIKRLGSEKSEAVKDLAYCLYDICSNRRSDAKEATAYNSLIAVWADLTRLAATIQDVRGDAQSSLDL